MRYVILKARCKRDLERAVQRDKDREKFLDIARLLSREGRVPIHRRPHKLSGEYAGLWECHIESDWLLIYDISDEEVVLVRTGSHTDLFG